MTQKRHFDDEDVKAALKKTDTADGPGFDREDELPENDFNGFAEDGAENEGENPK